MLRLPPFDYLTPHCVEEAAALLHQYGPEAMLVAGGTDLLPNLKRALFTPQKLIGLRQLAELRTVTPDNRGGIRLGAGLTLSEIANNHWIQTNYPALTTAVLLVSTPQLRNAGTLGGNLCLDTRCTYYNQSESWRQALGYCMKKAGHVCWVAPGSDHCLAVQSSDTAPILIALDAQVRLVGPTQTRWLPLQALYQADGLHYLQKAPDEILVDVVIPPPTTARMSYLKLRRRAAFDFPVLSVAAALWFDEAGLCTQARLVLGALHAAPLRLHMAEQMLIGQRPDADLIEAVAQVAYQSAKPLDNTDMSLSYRKQMVRVYVARALRTVLQQQ